jgi:hypothetical protein
MGQYLEAASEALCRAVPPALGRGMLLLLRALSCAEGEAAAAC